MNLEEVYIQSPVGIIQITGNEKGICSITYPDEGIQSERVPDCLLECVQQLEEYFAGTRKQFTVLINPDGTDFQLKVWSQLLTIPYAKTISYLDLALLTGSKYNTRAVGNANGKNKLNIIVPCHRVIGASGKLTGYGGGLWRKEWLLKHEKSHQPEGLFDF